MFVVFQYSYVIYEHFMNIIYTFHIFICWYVTIWQRQESKCEVNFYLGNKYKKSVKFLITPKVNTRLSYRFWRQWVLNKSLLQLCGPVYYRWLESWTWRIAEQANRHLCDWFGSLVDISFERVKEMSLVRAVSLARELASRGKYFVG